MIKTRGIITLAALMLCCMVPTKAQEKVQDDGKYTVGLLKVGDEAPDFVIENGDTLAGMHLKDFRGRYVVLDFWASWCGDCRREIPAVKALHKRFASDGVVFIGVSVDQKKEAWMKCVRDNGMEWVHHSELKPWKATGISADYNIKWIPTMYVVDPKGRIALATIKTEEVEKYLSSVF